MGNPSFYNWKNLPYALTHPCAIFKGLERDGHEHSYCYVAKSFTPGPIFQPEADLLTIYFEDQDHYAERVDEFLTVFLSFNGDKLIGFELKGIRHKAEEMLALLNVRGSSKMQVDVKCDPHINLLLTIYMKDPLKGTRETYQEVYDRARDITNLRVTAELVH